MTCKTYIPAHACFSAKSGSFNRQEVGEISAGMFVAGLLIGGITVPLLMMVIKLMKKDSHVHVRNLNMIHMMLVCYGTHEYFTLL